MSSGCHAPDTDITRHTDSESLTDNDDKLEQEIIAFHILEPFSFIQILNAFLEVLLNLTLKLRVLFLVL